MTPSRQFTTRLNPELYARIAARAKATKRTINKEIEALLASAIDLQPKVADVLADPSPSETAKALGLDTLTIN